MQTYPKIETLFERSKDDFKVIEGVYRRPEFENIKSWLFTEKVDGTNIRIRLDRSETKIAGRTDKAEIPAHLMERLGDIAIQVHPQVTDYLNKWDIESITLFGEGFGPKIQKGGGLYGDTVDFIGFDVLVNDDVWLQWHDAMAVFNEFGLRTAPLLGTNVKVDDIVAEVKEGFVSALSDKILNCEGVVARPRYNLYDQRGNRVMWKLKNTDFHNPESRLL